METSISEEPIALDHLVPSRHQHRLKRRHQRSGRAKDHLCTSARPSPHTGTPLSRHCALGGEASSTHTASSITQSLYKIQNLHALSRNPPQLIPRSHIPQPALINIALRTFTVNHLHPMQFHCMGTMIDITRIKILRNSQRKHTPFRPPATPPFPPPNKRKQTPTPPPSQSQPNSSVPTFSFFTFSSSSFFSSHLFSSQDIHPPPHPPANKKELRI